MSRRPMTIRAFLDGRGIDEFPVPTICLKNGRPLLRRHWAGTVIDHDNIVTFVAQPLGGEQYPFQPHCIGTGQEVRDGVRIRRLVRFRWD